MPQTSPSLDDLEQVWAKRWEQDGTYRFTPPATRAEVFSIDTPPPTVSGSLHIGHVFSYTHADLAARFARMRGKRVFYPMGWDDNGLPTERRVQNYYGVSCDPSLPYDPDFTAPPPGGNHGPVSRRNFIELCHELTAADERAFEQVWRRLGLSVDWSLTYTTIGPAAQRVSQRDFLRLLRAGEAYQAVAPVLWDTGFQTAVAQAELEDRDHPGAWYRIGFDEGLQVDTTRPELLPACVALIAHPDDQRYQRFFGGTVRVPLFGSTVPVLAHAEAKPELGTGLVMCCTFGDLADVTWWRQLRLPARVIIGRDGRLRAEPPDGLTDAGRRAYADLAGRSVTAARDRMTEALREAGTLLGEPRPVVRPVKFYERGTRPLEIVASRQWFIRSLAHREALLRRGGELAWTPAWMKARYDDWVCGLNTDWLISRQRFFGVPFPVWYPLGPDGAPDHAAPIVPDEAALPIDPASAVPAGYTKDQRGRPGGFAADPDVMDTWATSSLSPQIVSGEHAPVTYPMDLRPQAHDIIRTWLFATVLRAQLATGELPWRQVLISGWVLDPDRKKMSKSKGNVVTPLAILEKYGSDAARYWAASGRPGTDTTFDEGQLRVGRRLATKVLNAARFVLTFEDPGPAEITEPLDLAMLAALGEVTAAATGALEALDYTAALEVTERFFWTFCDDYLELVKRRAYGDGAGAASARAALREALSVQLRLLAPYLVFATEEAWSWWRQGSVHTSQWPRPRSGVSGSAGLLALVSVVIAGVRRAKAAAKLPLRAPVAELRVCGSPEQLELVKQASGDIAAASGAAPDSLKWQPADGPLHVEVRLA